MADGATDYAYDGLGRLVSDGQLAGSRAYGPFGQQTAGEGVGPGLGYQHQYTDPGSGNVNMGVRWYQPDAGTFASRDTTGLDPRDVGNANRYAYVGGDPLGRTDPTGRCFGVCTIGISVGIGTI
ncbi:RHS repeat-associated core domain-containing protein, partial [Prauserella aidingensis]|uniref:RHS repeat-associated core domain-containing protein n=1 Tax=Prauserella aidingensis TaxID=387890 RepID=UPI0027E2D724